MADDDYKHGEMDISAQEKTFDGFMRYVVNIGIVCIAIIIFLAIFATERTDGCVPLSVRASAP
jgi:small-conductance mechanosensitive channel